jgi:superfamily II DNA or RNA helicase/HKD family nuclease
MRLRETNFKTEYRSGTDNLVRDFYVPALALCTQYWRAVGFFSSSAFEAVGEQLVDFAQSGGEMRLVTSVHLEDEDASAIEKGLEKRQAIEARLLEIIETDFPISIESGTAFLISMLEAGKLDIRIAVPEGGNGIYHEKVGIFLASDSEYIAFTGSSNESRAGLEINYECVDVFTSWEDLKRAKSKKEHFELLWDGVAPGVQILNFPEAAKLELIKRRKAAASHQDDNLLINTDIPLWEHQREAAEIFLSKKKGVLEMATGTGKTRTSLSICQKLFEKEIDTIIIAADGDDLLDQWYAELLDFVKKLNSQVTVLRQYSTNREREHFVLYKKNTIFLSSRYFLPGALKSLSDSEASRTILIHDEVHRLGSPNNREKLNGLSENIRYRLGLSATPEREYDQEGNEFIEKHIGEIIYRFGLDEAIRKGILSPFNYFPLEYVPNENDRIRLQQVYKKAVARKEAGNPMSDEEMWIEKARVHKTSRAKLPVFEKFIKANPHLLRRCIIFVETREYGDEVLSIVHKYRPDFHIYYADEDSQILRDFAEGQIECLITCHRLSEGIDIHSLETVILFSSSKAQLETIQRIGRCLRKNPADPAKRANVVDFIRVSDQEPRTEGNNPDFARRDWLEGLSRIEPEK